MCLMAMAWGQHPRFVLVLAANRDEFHDRASAPMDWWPDGQILGGQDLQAGGTWLGISPQGRIGLLTNVREPGLQREGLASRGHIVPRWLEPAVQADTLRHELAQRDHNGFNLLALDVAAGHAHWLSNRHGHLDPLPHGLHGLSNAALNTPWPKVKRLQQSVQASVALAGDPQGLCEDLLARLTDRHQPEDHELPATGIAPDWERRLGRIFIETPDQRYGTRCSTVIVVERTGADTWTLHALEQNWDRMARPTERRTFELVGRFKRDPAGTA